jgi:hypothetical protein
MGAARRRWGSCDGRDKEDTQSEVPTRLVLVLSMSTRGEVGRIEWLAVIGIIVRLLGRAWCFAVSCCNGSRRDAVI